MEQTTFRSVMPLFLSSRLITLAKKEGVVFTAQKLRDSQLSGFISV